MHKSVLTLSNYASTPTAFTPYMATQLEQAIVFRLCEKLGKVRGF